MEIEGYLHGNVRGTVRYVVNADKSDILSLVDDLTDDSLKQLVAEIVDTKLLRSYSELRIAYNI